MVKKFTANCDFGGQRSPVTLYVGNPMEGSHPLAFQSKWLSSDRGGIVPNEIMDSFSRLSQIADKNKVSFEELCSYVIDELNSGQNLASQAKRAHEFNGPPETNSQVEAQATTATPPNPVEQQATVTPTTSETDQQQKVEVQSQKQKISEEKKSELPPELMDAKIPDSQKSAEKPIEQKVETPPPPPVQEPPVVEAKPEIPPVQKPAPQEKPIEQKVETPPPPPVQEPPVVESKPVEVKKEEVLPTPPQKPVEQKVETPPPPPVQKPPVVEAKTVEEKKVEVPPVQKPIPQEKPVEQKVETPASPPAQKVEEKKPEVEKKEVEKKMTVQEKLEQKSQDQKPTALTPQEIAKRAAMRVKQAHAGDANNKPKAEGENAE